MLRSAPSNSIDRRLLASVDPKAPERSMKSLSLLAICSLMVVGIGCRQGGNPASPAAPLNPFGGTTRVPPPATGSYTVPATYHQNQSGQNQSGLPQSVGSASIPGEGLTLASSQPKPPVLRGMPVSEPAALGNSEVQPASYQSDVRSWSSAPQNSSGTDFVPTVGSGLSSDASSDASSKMTVSSVLPPPTTEMRPPLRGMQPIDLTSTPNDQSSSLKSPAPAPKNEPSQLSWRSPF